MKLFYRVFMVAVLGFLTSCSHVEKFPALEGDKDLPYESLGTLEVKTKINELAPNRTFWGGVEALTLTFAKTPSRADDYKRALKAKLVDRAKNHYGADAVIKVEYWPDPESDKFAHGMIYARGEMIKYERFPTAS